MRKVAALLVAVFLVSLVGTPASLAGQYYPTVGVYPAVVNAGDTITISWSGLDPKGTYWVGMYETWALDTRSVEGWAVPYVSGSMSVMAPRVPDTYELRLFWGGQRIATSPVLTVVQQQKLTNNWYGTNPMMQLCIGTELYQGSQEKYPVTAVVHQHAEWVQRIDGPRYYDNHVWFDVRRQSGQTGWVIQGQADCEVPSRWRVFLGWNQPEYGDIRVIVRNLRFRTGPGYEYQVLGYVSHEDYYPVLYVQGDWGLVRSLDGMEGWINLSPDYVERLVYG